MNDAALIGILLNLNLLNDSIEWKLYMCRLNVIQ